MSTTGPWIACVNFARTATPAAYDLAPDSNYTMVHYSGALPLSPSDSTNFVYAAGRPIGDTYLYAVKTQNVGSGKVEVHVISRSAHYGSFVRQKPSPIDVIDGRNFDFLVGEYGDLICVKRRNAESRFVEVHVLIWDEFRHFSVQTPSAIPLSIANNFDFAVTSENRLVAIERAGTPEGTVVLHFLSEDYRTVTRRAATSLTLAAASDLTFRYESFRVVGVGVFSNLLGFTRGSTSSGRVEIIKLAQPWTGAPTIFPTPIRNFLAPNFQFVVLYPPPTV